jgi:YkoY family integral membrane protein
VADIATVATLAILESVLSVDNALVLAILVRTLPKHQQKKALTYGIVGAFVFRFLALVFVTYLMRLIFFKLVGGAYLIYLAMKHMFFFYKEDAHQLRPNVASSFWKTVLMVEFTDIAFSIDSITMAVAMSEKVLVVWAGGVLGMLSLRLVSGMLVRILENLPKLEDLAYQLIFFIGIKLSLDAFNVKIEHWIFWMMMGVITLLGSALVYRDYYQRRTKNKFHDHLLARLDRGEMSLQELLGLENIPRQVIEYLMERNCLRIEVPPEHSECDGSGQPADTPPPGEKT